MKKILIATGNSHKINEIKLLLQDFPGLKILSLKDFCIKPEITEDKDSLEKNSLKKARETYNILKIPCVSDDTGLFVEALNGAPGVHSARYSGENATYDSNCRKLLYELKDIPAKDRNAYFETVICLYINDNENYFFNGICKGRIINEVRGKYGFGYDPVFVPEGYDRTFAEMTNEEKNNVSHRSAAVKSFAGFLKN
ncbi:MAG: RdgB/HAM1 family non-canonical purine NTP pyrophosphatase [Ignavibacteria bacterium]|nr:RdgB/HAM1 family non-canonical purine NTP pyrophosphatase [Ignavibacteria bacterium]